MDLVRFGVHDIQGAAFPLLLHLWLLLNRGIVALHGFWRGGLGLGLVSLILEVALFGRVLFALLKLLRWSRRWGALKPGLASRRLRLVPGIVLLGLELVLGELSHRDILVHKSTLLEAGGDLQDL